MRPASTVRRPLVLLCAVWAAAACGSSKANKVEVLVERQAQAREGGEKARYLMEIRSLGVWVVPELRRIAADTSFPENVRSQAALDLVSEPTAIPTLMALVDDPSDTVRSSATVALHSCLYLGAFEPGDESTAAIAERYRGWWAEHRDDYMEAERAVREGRTTAAGDSMSVRELFDAFTTEAGMSIGSGPARAIIGRGRSAVPDLAAIGADTSIPNHFMAYVLLGRIDDAAAVEALLDALERNPRDPVRQGIVMGLDRHLRLGTYRPGDTDADAVVRRYLEAGRRR